MNYNDFYTHLTEIYKMKVNFDEIIKDALIKFPSANKEQVEQFCKQYVKLTRSTIISLSKYVKSNNVSDDTIKAIYYVLTQKKINRVS